MVMDYLKRRILFTIVTYVFKMLLLMCFSLLVRDPFISVLYNSYWQGTTTQLPNVMEICSTRHYIIHRASRK
jgi:hypothetical protein